MNILNITFISELESGLYDNQNHCFIVPRRIGTTRALQNLAIMGEGFYEKKEILGFGLGWGNQYESLLLNNGCEIIVGSGNDYRDCIFSLQENAVLHQILM